MASTQASRGLVGLFKRGWNEIPEIIGSSCMALLGVGLGSYGVYRYYQNDGDNKRFKMSYVVYRSDDPRAAKVRKD